MTEENKRLLALGKPILQPYQLWLLKVPNEHSSDILPPKTRPVMILETYFDKSDFEDDDFDASQVFPDFVVGTTNMRYIDWKGTLAFTDAGDLSAMKLRKPTVFRFDQVVERNLQADLSVKDIMENGTFISDVPEEIRKRIHDYINDLGIANLKLPESLLRESKADIQSFTDKFGDDTYAEFRKSSQRLKNAGMSADMLTYVRDETMSKDKLDKILFNLANHIKTVKSDMSKIGGEYKYLGSAKGYDVYQPLDAESSMNLGVGSGWCTTGRYGHYGEENFKPSLDDAEKHWIDYTSKGVKFYYFLQDGKGMYALAVYPDIFTVNRWITYDYFVKHTNIEIYDASDNLDYEDLYKLPLDLVPEKIVLDVPELGKDASGKLVLSKDGRTLLKAADSITDAVIPNTVTSIGDKAFMKCRNLQSVNIPNGVTSIGENAFSYCVSLQSVTIPDSVTSIGEGAFSICSSLKSVTIPSTVASIGAAAFSNCSSLESIVIPDSITSIGAYVFLDDRYLRSIKVRRAGGTSYAYDTLGAEYGYSIVTYDSAPVTESLPGNEVPHPEAYYIDASGRIIPVENHMDYDNDHSDEAEDNGYVRVRVKGFKLIEFPGSPTDEQMRAIADAVKAMGHVGSVSLNVRGSGLPGEDVSLRGDSVSRVMISVEDMIHPF